MAREWHDVTVMGEGWEVQMSDTPSPHFRYRSSIIYPQEEWRPGRPPSGYWSNEHGNS